MGTRWGLVFLQFAPCPPRTSLPSPPESSLEATFWPKYQGQTPYETFQVPGPALAGGCGQPWAGDGRELLHACLSLPGYALYNRHGRLFPARPDCATHSCRPLMKAQCRLWWCPGVLHHLPEAWLLSDMTPRDVESEWQSQDLNSERSTPDTSVEPQDLPPLSLCGSS